MTIKSKPIHQTKSNTFLFDTPGWSVNSSSSSNPLSSSIKPEPLKKTNQSNPITSTRQNYKQKKIKSVHHQEETHSSSTTPNGLSQNLMLSNLSGSRFRILNETLYTSTGPEAAKLFSNQSTHPSKESNPDFLAYHQGFKQQTKNWPENPVKMIANQLKKQFESLTSESTVIVADLGCGEAPLAKILCGENRIRSEGLEEEAEEEEEDQEVIKRVKVDRKVNFRVMSFDLVTDSDGWVIQAECSTKVPLPGSPSDQVDNGMVDVVVCCLSLMGTNWVGMILEARRILKQGGQLKIAEVSSRFTNIDQFIDFIKLIGFSTPTQDRSNSHFILFEV
ncbi:methyltransferase-domain-containing protein [Melampsora americana]|nr:methyltransferase-domain-containing protein [Melampsora americana]